MENAVGFFADLGEAVPDLPVMVYANRFFFKFDFPVEFWQGIAAKAPDGHRDEGRLPAHPGAPRRRRPPGQLHDRRGHHRDALPARARVRSPRPGRPRPRWVPSRGSRSSTRSSEGRRPPRRRRCSPTSRVCRCRSRTSPTSTSTTSSSRRRASTPRATRSAARPARRTATSRRLERGRGDQRQGLGRDAREVRQAG